MQTAGQVTGEVAVSPVSAGRERPARGPSVLAPVARLRTVRAFCEQPEAVSPA